MASLEEICALARRIAAHEVAWDTHDWRGYSDEDQRQVLSLACYALSCRKTRYRPNQRKAMRLLKSWLTPVQVRQLRRSQRFMARGSDGGMYRLFPTVGLIEKIERHGQRWFAKWSYCFHDDGRELPPADLSLAHFCHVTTDEPDFLARANATRRGEDMWSTEYRRRLRDAAARRASAETTEEQAVPPVLEASCEVLGTWNSEVGPDARPVLPVLSITARQSERGAAA